MKIELVGTTWQSTDGTVLASFLSPEAAQYVYELLSMSDTDVTEFVRLSYV